MTLRGTAAAAGTAASIDPVYISGMGMLRAIFEAGTAGDAPGRVEFNLPLYGKRFRVMAPGAAAGTALQKNSRANTRPVMHGKPLDVEDNP